jgi:hypothetical protein
VQAARRRCAIISHSISPKLLKLRQYLTDMSFGKRRKQQQVLRSRLAEGTIITTSFTDKQPLHGWKLEHALRELYQNTQVLPSLLGIAISQCKDRSLDTRWLFLTAHLSSLTHKQDGIRETFGGTPIPRTVDREPGLYEIAVTAGGPAVASVDCTTSGILRIIQQDIVLEPKHLQLASSKGTASAGSHGEGVLPNETMFKLLCITVCATKCKFLSTAAFKRNAA